MSKRPNQPHAKGHRLQLQAQCLAAIRRHLPLSAILGCNMEARCVQRVIRRPNRAITGPRISLPKLVHSRIKDLAHLGLRIGHYLHGRASGHLENDLRRSGTLQARKHIASLRNKEPNAQIEIRWCPSHQGIDCNEVADQWAKHAADEPDAHGVEWFSTTNPDGSVSTRKFPLPRSLANDKRGFSEQKRKDASNWAKKQLARTRNRKYRPGEQNKPDQTVAKAKKRLASRFYQMKTGHCLTGQYLAWTTHRPDATCWWCLSK